MAEEYSLFDYPAEREQDRQPLWKPSSERSKSEPKACIVSGGPAPAGSCEFVLEPLYVGSLGRRCRFGGSCFLFADSATYASCPTRIEKLKEKT